MQMFDENVTESIQDVFRYHKLRKLVQMLPKSAIVYACDTIQFNKGMTQAKALVVTSRNGREDFHGRLIDTSTIQRVELIPKRGLVVHTQNSIYICPES